jgi:hypothetical protein
MPTPSTRVNFGCITTKARRKESDMMLIGVDYHPSFQTIAFFVEETDEYGEQELNHRLENHAGLAVREVTSSTR